MSGGPLHISELACDDSGVTIRGRFSLGRFSRLDAEQTHFLETFLRCKGTITQVEKELGISYPTVKSRLEALLAALDLAPAVDDRVKPTPDQKQIILDQLERGDITAEEAKAKLRGIR